MRAAFYVEHGGPEKLQIGERPKPRPAPGEVLIRNMSAAIGAWDLGVMKTGYGNPPLPHVPSTEIAGIVEATRDVPQFKPGDTVYGGLGFRSGGLAEYVTGQAERLEHKPETLSFAEAAALVVPAVTAYEGLVDRAGLQAGDTVLITAASGNVGVAAVQIAAAGGATVFAVASRRHHDHLRALGATAAFDYHNPDWTSQLKMVAPEGVDVVFDGAGSDTRARAVDTVKAGGRCVFIVGPPEPLRPDIEPHSFSADVTRGRLAPIGRLVSEGKLKANIAAELPLQQAPEAMALLDKGDLRGRVILSIASSSR